MKFLETSLPGALLIELELLHDERGFFARTFCSDELHKQGVSFQIVQCNISYNRLSGTLRGMHFQKEPKAEDKLVSCIRGAIYDVIVDLRDDSPTLGKWFGVELSVDNRRLLYVPRGLAHGFQTLTDDAEVYYQMSEFYSSAHASGVRYDDPALNINWPIPVTVISEKDRLYQDCQL